MLDPRGPVAESPLQSAASSPAVERPDAWFLLLRACRADVTGLGNEVARRFPDRGASDWDALVALVDVQGVGSLAATALLSIDAGLVPDAVRRALHERVLLGRLRERILVPELLGILEAFEERGVEAIAYKGPALASLAYGQPSLRESVDLDLVVRDVPAAEEVLRRRGYRRNKPPESLRPPLEAAWRAAGHAAEFVSGDGLCFVDLHWRMCPLRYPFRVAPTTLWSRPARARLGGREVRVFPTETLVGLLCLHGTKDRWRRLIWLCDVDRLVRISPSLDWEEVRRFAEEARCRRAVRLGLLLASRLLATPLPGPVLGWLGQEPQLAQLAARVEDQIVSGGVGGPWWLETFGVRAFHLEVFDHWIDGARYVGRTLATAEPGDWELRRIPLPDALFPLYAPLRLARKVAVLVRESVRRAFA
jgi:putative nucleotidyltransferase-like protein